MGQYNFNGDLNVLGYIKKNGTPLLEPTKLYSHIITARSEWGGTSVYFTFNILDGYDSDYTLTKIIEDYAGKSFTCTGNVVSSTDGTRSGIMRFTVGSTQAWSGINSSNTEFPFWVQDLLSSTTEELGEAYINAPVQDVQVNGTSVVNNGIAEIPSNSNDLLLIEGKLNGYRIEIDETQYQALINGKAYIHATDLNSYYYFAGNPTKYYCDDCWFSSGGANFSYIVPTANITSTYIYSDHEFRDAPIYANKSLSGNEPDLTSLQVGSTTFKVPSGGSSGALLIEKTYLELKTLRDNSQLVPGTWYRITDYTCTTTTTNTSSAEHVFDILVLATDVNKLSEEARAIKHSGDTYFTNNNLEAWKLWYCLDNDTNRFDWASSITGKGVIYRMIDEFNNDVPYDFKNILFNNKYTFCCFSDGYKDSSLNIAYSVYHKCTNNIMKADNSYPQTLSFNVFYTEGFSSYYCFNNFFDVGCKNNTLGAMCHDNIFGIECKNNTLATECATNTFKLGCNNISLQMHCFYNIFNEYCSYISLHSSSTGNIFGFGCRSLFINNYLYQNSIFGNDCSYLTIIPADTTLDSISFKNIHIHSGVTGTDSSSKTITIDNNVDYFIDVYPIDSKVINV